jgi:acetyl-CoA carboxylase biotin carboxyl carrier protein
MARLSVDEDLVRHLARLLEETGLTELEYDTGKVRVRVSRGGGPQMVVSAPVVATAAPAGAIPAPGPTEAAAHPGAVTAPMVGTVYVAPEPGATPFVKVGDRVNEGDVLFIIEAMKTMNPIKAPRAGAVTQIFAANAQPVEYGEVLLILE